MVIPQQVMVVVLIKKTIQNPLIIEFHLLVIVIICRIRIMMMVKIKKMKKMKKKTPIMKTCLLKKEISIGSRMELFIKANGKGL